eukprot:190732-Chlamydomonas_euryale.AAC.14
MAAARVACSVTMQSYPPPMPLPAPMSMAAVDPAISSESIDSIPWFMTKEQEAASHQLRFRWTPGVAGALTKLEAFFDSKLPVFDHERAKVDRESTSELSPWVHIGSISIRYVFYRVSCRMSICRMQIFDAEPPAELHVMAAGINQSA